MVVSYARGPQGRDPGPAQAPFDVLSFVSFPTRARGPVGLSDRACYRSWPEASPRFVFWLLPSRLSRCLRPILFSVRMSELGGIP